MQIDKLTGTVNGQEFQTTLKVNGPTSKYEVEWLSAGTVVEIEVPDQHTTENLILAGELGAQGLMAEITASTVASHLRAAKSETSSYRFSTVGLAALMDTMEVRLDEAGYDSTDQGKGVMLAFAALKLWLAPSAPAAKVAPAPQVADNENADLEGDSTTGTDQWNDVVTTE